jgi:hypothetical protein
MNESGYGKLIARLLAARTLPRSDREVLRMLTDEGYRLEVERRLADCGLRLLDNPFAEHIALALADTSEPAVFAHGDQWLNNTLGLQRDGVALLVLLWALIILPKRERQLAHQTSNADGQNDMFAADKPMPVADASRGVAESVLRNDYADRLGKWSRININLGILSRTGFIERRSNVIYEGPLLDLAFDYSTLAPRIIDGALGDLLARRRTAAAENNVTSDEGNA